MLSLVNILEVFKIITLSSVFFVWFIRYENIVEEFKSYGYSNKLRDLVGILKISSVILIQNSNPLILKLGSAILGVLMLAAVITHIRVKNPILEMLPSFTLMIFSILFFIQS